MNSIFSHSLDTVKSWLPENRNTSLMADDDFAIVMMLELNFQNIEGKDQVTRKGNIIKNPMTLSPIPPKQVIQDYFKERGWLTSDPKNNNGGLDSLSKFSKDYEKRTGKIALGVEFYSELNNHVKTVRNFNYYE